MGKYMLTLLPDQAQSMAEKVGVKDVLCGFILWDEFDPRVSRVELYTNTTGEVFRGYVPKDSPITDWVEVLKDHSHTLRWIEKE